MKPVKSPWRSITAAPALVLMCILTLTVFLASCGKKKEAEVALIINGMEITYDEINEIIDVFRLQQMRLSPESVFDGGRSEEMRRGAARRMAADLLMLDVIKAKQWKADSAAVEAAMNSFVMFSAGGLREAFLAQLEAMGETEESVRKSLAEGILLDSLMKSASVIDPIDDSEAQAYYEENKERYTSPGRARASQIFIAFNPADDSPGQAETMMKKVREALEKAQAGHDFAELVKTYSTMTADDGDMGWFKKGGMSPEFDRALFSIKKGEVSDIVPSGMGFHILKKTDEEDPRQMEYEEVSDAIKRTLTGTKREKAVNGYIDSLIRTANIRFLDPSLDFMTATAP